MSHPPSIEAPHARGLSQSLATLGQRRRFLVDPRMQLRAGALTAGACLILLVLLNVALFSAREQLPSGLAAEGPEAAQSRQAQHDLEAALVISASLVFLVGVFVATVLETHKTAGAALNVARHMAQIRDGQYNTRIRLRKDDNLRQLERDFNEMTSVLQDRLWRDVELLESLARTAEGLGSSEDAAALARTIRAQADEKRQMTD